MSKDSRPSALCLDVLRMSSGKHGARLPHDCRDETVMTIELGVGQGVVKIRTSPYILLQPFAMTGMFFVIAASDPRGLAPLWLMGPAILAVALWTLTWGVDLTPESANLRGIRRRSIPWQEVQAVVRTGPTGSSMVRLILENGKHVWVRAPRRVWGFGGARFDRDFDRIGQWWLAHRGESWRPERPEAPRPPYGLPDTR